MAKPHDRVAYATFYSSRVADENDEDPYFDAAQLLIYQILHHPSTRTRFGIPLLVFVVPHVSEARRQRFRFLGATVVAIDYVTWESDWIQPRRERWVDQMCKLRIFEQISYDRILYIDADMLLTRSLDGIWSEPISNQMCTTRREMAVEESSAAELPTSYMFVGVPDTYSSRKPNPPFPNFPEVINAGFWLASPSLEMFDYYTSLLSIPGSFDSQYMEQGVFRHAHRDDGPMPWKKFETGKWNVNWPRVEDFWRGTATLHDRFWITDRPWMEPVLVQLWNAGMKAMVVFRRKQAMRDIGFAALLAKRNHERFPLICARRSWMKRNMARSVSVECA